jgi:hypothetical protein
VRRRPNLNDIILFARISYFFSSGIKWGINESNAYRIVIRAEKVLINSSLFNLPGKKKSLSKSKWDRNCSGGCVRA